MFTTPAPEGVEYVGRNHPLVEGLARYLLEDALELKTPKRRGVALLRRMLYRSARLYCYYGYDTY